MEQDLNNVSVKLHICTFRAFTLYTTYVSEKNRSIIGTNILQHGMHDEILHAANELLI